MKKKWKCRWGEKQRNIEWKKDRQEVQIEKTKEWREKK